MHPFHLFTVAPRYGTNNALQKGRIFLYFFLNIDLFFFFIKISTYYFVSIKISTDSVLFFYQNISILLFNLFYQNIDTLLFSYENIDILLCFLFFFFLIDNLFGIRFFYMQPANFFYYNIDILYFSFKLSPYLYLYSAVPACRKLLQ